MERVNGHESFLAFSSRGALSLSLSILDASFKFPRRVWFPESPGQLCVRSKEHLVESYVFSVVIRVFVGSTSASVRMHRKGFAFEVQDAASRRRKLVESQNGQGSREAPGPSVPGRVRFAASRQMSIWVVRVPTRCRFNFWIPRNGNWRRAVVSSARKT